jgi:uncharacterized protein (TIRG00374 family)
MKTVERIALVGGVVLLGWLVYRIGLRTVFESVERVGWGFSAIVAFYAVIAILNTLAWRATTEDAQRVPFLVLLGFLLAGDAVNAVTPSAVVGGELVRIGLLRRRMPGAAAAASVALAATCQFVAQLVFVLASLPIVFGEISGSNAEQGLLVLAGLGSAAAIAFILIVLLRGRSFFGRIHGFLARRFPERFGRTDGAARWRSLDESIFGALRERPGALARAFVLYLAAWTMGAVETALILFLLGAPVGIRGCVAIEALAVMVDTLLFFVPARIGTQEGGKYAIFRLFRLDQRIGFALGLVRRLRELVWPLVGLAVLAGWQQRREFPGAETGSAEVFEGSTALPKA